MTNSANVHFTSSADCIRERLTFSVSPLQACNQYLSNGVHYLLKKGAKEAGRGGRLSTEVGFWLILETTAQAGGLQ